MNHLDLSASTKKLLATAKTEVPSSAARANVWVGVSGVVGGAAAAGASGAAASTVLTGGAGATKLLAMGALFGGALTVGLATVLLQIGVAPAPRTATSPTGTSPNGSTLNAATAGQPQSPVTVTRLAPIEPGSVVIAGSAPPATESPGAAATPALTHAPIGHAHRHARTRDDSLAREASLVAEARGALAVGDPRSALRAIREARALPSKQLVPEELAVEEQALRALGQNDEANGIDVMLRLQYPESALAP
jgi:hypothetical protein